MLIVDKKNQIESLCLYLFQISKKHPFRMASKINKTNPFQAYNLFFYLLVIFLTNLSLYAQTTLISPTGAGGFELGNTFAANGWSATTGTATQNQWTCNTGATAGFSGVNAAYITNNTAGTPPTHFFTINNNRVSHLYRNFTVPAGETIINLSFSWISNGDGQRDKMRVYLIPSATTPVYGTALAAAGAAPTGIVQLGANFSGQNTWANATYTVPAAYAGTTCRLVFEWSNNNNGGNQPPAAVDNISLTSAAPAPILGDECANAIPLSVSSVCNYTTYSNAANTASAGIPAPGCASYSGGDIWFSAVVPFTGILTVDTQTGVITDGGMAFYTGTCGALTLLQCDDDSSANGLMPTLTATGLTPGSTVYIRFWEYSNDNNGTFGICATSPLCGNPSFISAVISSQTTANITWTAPIAAPANGYQYYLSTSSVTPGPAATPTGSLAAGVTSLSLTGLTPLTTYYIWIRSNCGGPSDLGAWIGATNWLQPNCAVGNSLGTTTLTCPFVISGGLGLNGADPTPISCTASSCVDLEATFLDMKQTTTYSVANIPYAPPYQFNCLKNPVSVNVDDQWSPAINLPFNFCYYGNNYNQCTIGSNGVLSFDLANNAPGGYSTWSFANNLPNNNLFLNTIFGVYHDIDPSIGGEIGWELITLNSGCSALVASWNNIPMFSATCNSSLYTGMIVLYENTNVIDVYVKTKTSCNTWNGGNAIVGIQNSTGTQAIVAPARNGLDANWNVTNEAWRFTPAGASLTTLAWYEGTTATGPVIGTNPILNVCPSSTTDYTAKVVYTFCDGTTMTKTDYTTVTVNNGKNWIGTLSTDWNTAANWTPVGVPNSTDCVVIPVTANNPIISGNGYNGLAGNITVKNSATLTIQPANSVTVADWVKVDPTGNFIIENNSSLLQVNNASNTGNITYKRTAQNIRNLDYVYWSSPVSNFNINSLVAPLISGPIYSWNPTVANPNGGQGNWQGAAGSIMTAGKGYIARGPSTFTSVGANLNATFVGVPNNGIITTPISRGSDTNTAFHTGLNGIEITNYSDNANLIGNPYPSALRASQFLFDNNAKIEGNIRLWTHGTLPAQIANPYYDTFVYNYTANDYFTYNFTGASCCPAAGADLFIGAGQGFFVQMKDGPAASNTVMFSNSMRNYTYSNSLFYRPGQTPVDVESIERNRIWVDLIDANGNSDRTLVGYIEGASMDKDSFFDCKTSTTAAMSVYSQIGTESFIIQGRALPFVVSDEIPMGMHLPTAGSYSLAIAGVDGLFNTQNVYIKDNSLQLIHDLKTTPYQFAADAGHCNNRFQLVFTNGTLGASQFELNNTISVVANQEIQIKSSNESMQSIVVYDVLGRKLYDNKQVNATQLGISQIQQNNTTLLVEITTQSGARIIKKIIY